MRTRSLLFLASLALTACSLVFDAAPAERAVEEFHASLDAGRFEALYDSAGDEMKNASSKQDFVAFVDAVHRKLGAVKAVEKIGTHRTAGTRGTFLVLTYRTTFTEGPATETFSFRIASGAPVLVGYNVNSNLLIVK